MRDSNDIITVLGVIGTDPEAKTTPSGVPLIKFRMASTQRKFDKNSNSWVDGNTNWYTVSAFRGLATNAIQTLHKGDPVIVDGAPAPPGMGHGGAPGHLRRPRGRRDRPRPAVGNGRAIGGRRAVHRSMRRRPVTEAARRVARPSKRARRRPHEHWATPGESAPLETTPF